MVSKEERLRKRIAFQKKKLQEEEGRTKLIRESRELKAKRGVLRKERARGGFGETFFKGARVVGKGTFQAAKGVATFTERVARTEQKQRVKVRKVSKKRVKKGKKVLKKQRKRATRVAPALAREQPVPFDLP